MKNILKFGLLISLTLLILSGCSDEVELEKRFGLFGTHNVTTFTANNYDFTTIYYPTDIAAMSKKSPIIFFISGWFGTPQTSSKYEALLNFIASHGYTVIYTDEGSTVDSQHAIQGFENMLANNEPTFTNQILPYIDTAKIGGMGHSAGGGTTLTTLKYYASAAKNYGANGRFIMGLDPWYAFDMSEDDIKTLPSNTNLVFIKFGERGFSINDDTDPRIVLTQYNFLESISSSKKDYQVYDQENADHSYPTGNRAYTDMQGILKPLDALLDFTFVEQSERTRVNALELGDDDPYNNGNGIQLVKPKNEYYYKCDGANTIIDYCEIID